MKLGIFISIWTLTVSFVLLQPSIAMPTQPGMTPENIDLESMPDPVSDPDAFENWMNDQIHDQLPEDLQYGDGSYIDPIIYSDALAQAMADCGSSSPPSCVIDRLLELLALQAELDYIEAVLNYLDEFDRLDQDLTLPLEEIDRLLIPFQAEVLRTQLILQMHRLLHFLRNMPGTREGATPPNYINQISQLN